MAPKPHQPPRPTHTTPKPHPPPPPEPVRAAAPVEEEESSEGSEEEEDGSGGSGSEHATSDASSNPPSSPPSCAPVPSGTAGRPGVVPGCSAAVGGAAKPPSRPLLAAGAAAPAQSGKQSRYVAGPVTLNSHSPHTMPGGDVVEGGKGCLQSRRDGGLGVGSAPASEENSGEIWDDGAPELFVELPQRSSSFGSGREGLRTGMGHLEKASSTMVRTEEGGLGRSSQAPAETRLAQSAGTSAAGQFSCDLPGSRSVHTLPQGTMQHGEAVGGIKGYQRRPREVDLAAGSALHDAAKPGQNVAVPAQSELGAAGGAGAALQFTPDGMLTADAAASLGLPAAPPSIGCFKGSFQGHEALRRALFALGASVASTDGEMEIVVSTADGKSDTFTTGCNIAGKAWHPKSVEVMANSPLPVPRARSMPDSPRRAGTSYFGSYALDPATGDYLPIGNSLSTTDAPRTEEAQSTAEAPGGDNRPPSSSVWNAQAAPDPAKPSLVRATFYEPEVVDGKIMSWYLAIQNGGS